MLKRLHCLVICCFLSAQLVAEESDRTMALSVSPVSLIFGEVNALFQHKIANFMSLTVPGIFIYSWPTARLISFMSKSTGIKVAVSKAPITVAGGLGARFYPTGKGMSDGFYVEPRALLKYSQFGASASNLGGIEWTTVTLSPMVNFGWEWFYDSGFYSNIGASVGYSYGLKSERKVSRELADAVKTLSYVFPSLAPNPDSRWQFTWELEFKLGWAF